MANKTVASKSFFSSVTKMTLRQLGQFLDNVLFKMEPSKALPLMIWSQPGLGKSQFLQRKFEEHAKGLKTVILSQIGALDGMGLPSVNEEGTTVFSPTNTFGRGKQNVFFDELNNAAPSVQAMVQNLMSDRKMGEDSYKDVYLIAACNPPSSNSLANDLPAPIMNRALHIMLQPDIADYMEFVTNIRPQHPAIVGFHKSTEGAFMMTQWGELTEGMNFRVPEPAANEPFPSARSWEAASNFLTAATDNGDGTTKHVDWTIVRALVEGTVGVEAAKAFASSYAYAQSLPDVRKIFSGELTAQGTEKTIIMQYMTAQACLNYCINRIIEADRDGVKMDLETARKTAKGRSESRCYQLLAGICHCLTYIGTSASAELATAMFGGPVSTKLRTCRGIAGSVWAGHLVRGVDEKNGLSSQEFRKYGLGRVINAAELADSLSQEA